MRKLTYYIATSFDGFVCRNDGSISDFEFEGEHVADILSQFPETIPTHLRDHFEIDAGNRNFDCVLMGRRTYELGAELGIVSPYQHLRQFICSTSLQKSPCKSISLVESDPVALVRQLKLEESSLGIWLCGGPTLASQLIDEIDEIIVKINPFLMGEGKSLFNFPLEKKRRLKLKKRRDYENGFSLVHFLLDTLVELH